MQKIMYFDVETTGLDPEKNDIIQLAYILEEDGVEKFEGNLKMQPLNWGEISEKALEVNGVTRSQLKEYPMPQKAHAFFMDDLQAFGAKWVIPCGYNVNFDIGFLKAWFKKMGFSGYGSMFTYKPIDPYQVIILLDSIKPYYLKNHKLETMARYYGIELQAHDAMSDIRATKKLLEIIKERHLRR